MPETGFIPWGAVFESGKKYRKLVAQSLFTFSEFFYCKYSTRSMVASLKREAIDGKPPPGVEPAAQHGKTHQVWTH